MLRRWMRGSVTPPKPLTEWQERATPSSLPRHIRRNVGPGADGCWLWLRSTSSDGYGWASLDDRTHQAHRLVYCLLVGDPPSGLVLDHLCRVRHCVNPDHLEPVTPGENLRRSELTPTGMNRCLRCGSEFVTIGVKAPQRRCPKCLADYNESRRETKRIAEQSRRDRIKAAP